MNFTKGLFVFSELLDVLRLVVERAGFPKPEDDADPFEGEGSDGGIVFAAGLSFLAIIGGRPGAPLACVVGEIMERLSQKFRAGVTPTQNAKVHYTLCF